MRLKHQQLLPGPVLEIFADANYLYVVVSASKGIALVGLNLQTLNPEFSKMLHPIPARLPFLLEDDVLWYIDINGRIIGLDTFSQEIVFSVEPTALLPLDFVKNGSNIVMLCGVPLVNRSKTATECFCLMSSTLKNEKLMQTQSMFGAYGSFLMDNSLWVAVGSSLYKYGLGGEPECSALLAVPSRFPLLLTDKHVISSSTLGCVEVFDRVSLEARSKFIVEKSNAPPCIHPSGLGWLTSKSACLFDYDGSSIESVPLQSPITLSLLYRNSILGSDESGNIIKFTPGDKVETLKIHNNSLKKAVVEGDVLFVSSEQYIYSIEVEGEN